MSSSIAIPYKRRHHPRSSPGGNSYGGSSIASSSSSSSSATPSPTARTVPVPAYDNAAPSWSPSSPTLQQRELALAVSPSSPSDGLAHGGKSGTYNARSWTERRRPSLLGTSLSKSEYTVVNVGGPYGPPRLITCVKASQGFDWNQEIFLPSYVDHDSEDLERRPDPIEDIILTDEEAAELLPQ